MNEFDELYNEFFRDKGNNKNKGGLSKGMKKMLKFVERLNETGSVGNISPEEDEMGPPTTRRVYEEDGVKLEECTWDTEYGTVVRIATIEDVEFEKDWFKQNGIPTGSFSKTIDDLDFKESTLEDKLKIAESVEDYETCANLRDEIKAFAEEKVVGDLKNNKGLAKKGDVSENIDDKDGWNF